MIEAPRTRPHEHGVHFYVHDDDLAATVGGRLASALGGDAGAVVIATRRHRAAFTLLCAHRAEDEAPAALCEECGLHSESTHRLAADRDAPRAARRFIRDALGPHPLAADAALIVSELATNAVVHAGTAFTVELSFERDGDGVRVAVADGRCGPPAQLAVQREHGLGIVARVAADWGADPRRDGTTVWAALRP